MADTHECLLFGCVARIGKEYAFCPAHWRLVPYNLQQEIYETHRLQDKQGWWNAIRRAQTIITEQERGQPRQPETALITGDTFPVKDQLKAMGGVWSPSEKGWRVPLRMKMAAEVLVGNADDSLCLDFEDEYIPNRSGR